MDGTVEWAIGLGASLACIIAAVAFSVLPKFAAVKWARALVLPLVMSGSAGLVALSVLGHTFGEVVGGGTSKASDAANSVAPGVRYAVPILLAVVVLVVFAHDVWAVSIGRRGIASAVLLPATLGFIPGALGGWAVALAGILPLAFAALFSRLIGLG